jgi:steroid delta-isomerase-like uncharacterized protein
MEVATQATERIDVDELRVFAERYLEAWNSRDPSAVGAFVTDDVVWQDPALPEPIHGRAGVEEFVAITRTAFPDYEFSEPAPYAIAEDGLTAYVPWLMRGTNAGPIDPPGFAPTGRAIEVYGIDRWEFRDGLICRYRAIYDFTEMARQLGLMPARGGAAERIGARLQRLGAKLRR